MKQWLNKYWYVFGFAAVAVFLCVCAGLMRGQYNSPDERANDTFIRSYVAGNGFAMDAPAQNAWLSYPLFPRSVQPVNNELKPVGFIGLSWVYGIIAGLVGLWVVPYLTIIAFAIGAWGWWRITRQVFGREIANVSVWLYALHPALLYYTARGLYPNMLVLTMVLTAVAAAMCAHDAWGKNWRTIVWSVVSVVTASIAIMARPPDAMVVFGLVALAAFALGAGGVRRAGKIALIIFVALAMLGWFARHVGAISGAYPFLRDSSPLGILFPFGIHIGLVWHNCTRFIIKLFWPYVFVSTTGVLWWLYRAWQTRQWPRMIVAYLCVVVPASIWLFVAYGSWQISDNPANAAAVTIGISYVRYWLPHLLFRMPFAVILIFMAREKFFPELTKKKLSAYLVVGLMLFGAWRLWSGVDGLGAVIHENHAAAPIVAEVKSVLPQGSVLAVRTWDKHFFPDVPVLQPFPQEIKTLGAVHELLAHHVPLYAFIDTLNATDELWLATNNLHASAVKSFGNQTLYVLSE